MCIFKRVGGEYVNVGTITSPCRVQVLIAPTLTFTSYVYAHSCKRNKPYAQHFKGIELKWHLNQSTQKGKESNKMPMKCLNTWCILSTVRSFSSYYTVWRVLTCMDKVSHAFSFTEWKALHAGIMLWVGKWTANPILTDCNTAISMFAMNIWIRPKLCTTAIYTTCYLCKEKL